MKWREGYVSGGDTRFWVREAGRGENVAVLLHGFPQDGSAWERVAALLVDQGWRVVAPDVKGVGRSDRPDSGYDPQTLADEISQLIRNLHVKKALLVGHDWGGAIALATAFRHPGRVSGVVLVAAPYRQLDLRRAWHIALCNIPMLPEVAFRLAPRPLVAAALRSQSRLREPFDASAIDAATTAVSGGQPPAWLGYYRTLSRRAVVDWAVRRTRRRLPVVPDPRTPHPLRVPVQVVWGEQDPIFPVSLGTRVARDLGADLDVLPGVGHHLHVEDPLGLARSIQRFATNAHLAPGTGADAVV
jgi:pimeloyl-ACP methyl ester carboxylesterase